MHDTDFAPEGFVPCAPMFVESADGFALTDEARELLGHLDPQDPTAPTLADELASIRSALSVLAAKLPAAVRLMEPHDLLDAADVLQEATNTIGALDQSVVAELDRQGVHETSGATSTAHLLGQRLRIRPAEAKRRVETALACTERVTSDAQVLPPLREHLAAAQSSGAISPDHASVIARTLSRLPSDVPVEESALVEQALVGYARQADPTEVAALGRRTIDLYDPDGVEPRAAAQRRRRDLTVWQGENGMGAIRGDLTADLLAKLLTVLSPLAEPRPSDADGDDTRTHGQRMHDALEEVCDRLLRSGTLPDSGGVPATVAVTIPISWLQERTGRVATAFGGDLTIRQLLHLACEAEIIPVVLNDAGGIMAHGRTKRFATAEQTKALRARDGGCSFPGCRRPPQWTERHHIREWLADDGPTDIGNLCLLCSYHHHGFEGWGWRVEMIDGMPWWVPPATLDPEQRPIRNHAHEVAVN